MITSALDFSDITISSRQAFAFPNIRTSYSICYILYKQDIVKAITTYTIFQFQNADRQDLLPFCPLVSGSQNRSQKAIF